jgi:hypothetical protein
MQTRRKWKSKIGSKGVEQSPSQKQGNRGGRRRRRSNTTAQHVSFLFFLSFLFPLLLPLSKFWFSPQKTLQATFQIRILCVPLSHRYIYVYSFGVVTSLAQIIPNVCPVSQTSQN